MIETRIIMCTILISDHAKYLISKLYYSRALYVTDYSDLRVEQK